MAVTLTASWYKIFSSDPLIGFFAQRDKYQQALDAGKVIPPAKSLDDVGQIVTNSTVDGVLSILFAALIIIVIADAARVWWQTLSGRREPVLAEAPAEESHLWAPSGLFPTAEDRERQAELRAEPVGAGRDRARPGSGGDGDDGPAAAGRGRRPLVRARGDGGERLRALPRPPAPGPSGRAGPVPPRVRVPPHGPDGGPAGPALLLNCPASQVGVRDRRPTADPTTLA